MRAAILVMCAIVAMGVFVAMYLAIWSTRDDPARRSAFRQHVVSEFVWATIPLLMLLAAAVPAATAVFSAGSP